MSYDLTGYKLREGSTLQEFYETMMHGEDEYQAYVFTDEEESLIRQILLQHGFERRERASPEYSKNSISADVFANQVGFSLPYWEDSEGDFQVLMRVAVEIFKQTGVVFWDQQESAVLTDKVLPSDQFEKMVKVVKQIPHRIAQNHQESRPWWRFW